MTMSIEYVTKLSYEVDGIKYTGKRTYYREVSIGEKKISKFI